MDVNLSTSKIYKEYENSLCMMIKIIKKKRKEVRRREWNHDDDDGGK